MREESLNGEGHAALPHFLIIGPILLNKLFVLALEFSRVRAAIVPEKNVHPPGLRMRMNSRLAFCGVEPMGGLRNSDDINTISGESCSFGSSAHAGKSRIPRQEFLSRPAHIVIRFHANYAIAVLKKQAREDSSAKSNIRNHGIGSQATFSFQEFDNFRWISRPITNIVPYPR